MESKFYLMRAGTAVVHSRGGARGGAASSSSNAAAPEPSGAPPPMGSPMGLSLDSGAAVCVEPMELDLSHLGALVLCLSPFEQLFKAHAHQRLQCFCFAVGI